MTKKQLSYALIVAGGKGKRMRRKTPKQFLTISDIPIMIKSLLPFEKSPIIDGIVIVLPLKWHKKGRNLLKDHGIKKAYKIVRSGKTRQASVYNGLVAMRANNPKIVVIHDAARPFISGELIRSTYNSAKRYGAATAAVAVHDTVYDEKRKIFLEKKNIVKIQTPQAFKYPLILESHILAQKRGKCDFPDDTSLLSFFKKKFVIVKGDTGNIKITDETDLTLARAISRRITPSR